MTGNDSILDVYLGKTVIAHLSLYQDQLAWQYTPDWQTTGFHVSPHLPLSNNIHNIPALNINRFLRNLLPEGHAFDELIQNLHISRNNTFALIRALGLDTSGALTFRSTQISLPEPGDFRLLTSDELSDRLDKRRTAGLIIWDGKPRLSMAGIQDKINIFLNSQGQIGFGEGSLCSTHILKFEQQTHAHLVINEYVTMRLAQSCGLKVAHVTLQYYGKHPALLVERFDRKFIHDTEIQRRHIIDGCQALNLPPEYKYERNFGSSRDVAHIRDGVSLRLLFAFANHCQNPALTKQQMLDWALYNILIYNFDAHGKNISFYVGTEGISLAPFYDLVNIKLYPDVDQDYAMAFGNTFNSNHIHAYQIADFSESCQLSRVYVAKRLKQMIEKMMHALSEELTKIKDEFGYESYLNDYQKIVRLRCESLITQCRDIPKIQL